MLISCNRLKKYIKGSEIIDWLLVWNKFTIRTAEVESVTQMGNQFDNVVVAEIRTCEKHPNSDHLHILTVDIGEKIPTQVVCGAPNVRVGLKTAFVKVGGHIDGMEITPRPLRGVESFGMCCSGKELGISDDQSGIIEFPDTFKNGADLKSILPIEDIIVEIDNKSLTNRPDLWGHYGIAREIAAITNTELIPLKLFDIVNDKKNLDIVINEPDLCYRYCGITAENIKNNKTPFDMQIFLYYVGMRSISLIVDVTNFVMLELGMPMHAFDKRVVSSIEVGLANDGDTYTTLDNVERKLSRDNLMIKNGDKYFAIAGVMGGEDSEILEDTTSIFLEGACFHAGSIRKTASYLGLRTEASARYEKSLDPNLCDIAIKRFLYLLAKENPYLKITSNLTDVYPTKLKSCDIKLTKEKLARYMGRVLDDKVVKGILERLDFKVKVNKDSYTVTVPTFRHSKDITIEEDLIEEVSRFYGFENYNPVPLKLDVISSFKENTYYLEYEIKNMLAQKYDMHEVHSYLWYNTNLLKELNIKKYGVTLLGKTDNNVLRDDLPLSLLKIVNENFKNYNSFNIFEIGTYIKDNINKRSLSILLCTMEKDLESSYNKAKDIVKYLFASKKHINVSLEPNSDTEKYYEKSLSKNIICNGTTVGVINVFKKDIISRLSKKKSVVAIDIDFELFEKLKKEEILAKEISKYPVVDLDYTIVVSTQKYANVKNILGRFHSNIIKSMSLIGCYENKYTVRYSVGANDHTLTQEELQKFKDDFINHVKTNGLNIIERG